MMAEDPTTSPADSNKGFFSKLKDAETLKEFLSTPTTQLGRAGRFVVFQIKLWSHCIRLLKKNRYGQQAAALSYHTIFGLVPLVIVMLWFFQALAAYEDVGQNLKTIVYKQLNLSEIKFSGPGEEERLLTDYLDDIIQTFFSGLNKGSLTLISFVIVIWAAQGLLSTIEGAFNRIWHVPKGRSLVHRIINYWAILTLGPLLVAVGAYIINRYEKLGELQRSIVYFSHFGPILLSYIIAVVVFFLLYFLLPNTKVQAKAAVWGAAVAALLWTFAKWGFHGYVTLFIPYSKIYGVVGLVPLGVFWIFITWLIVLFGLQLTYTTQHLRSLDAAEITAARKSEQYFIANDVTAINIVAEIASAFEENKAPVELEALCGSLDLPGEFAEKILQHLVDRGLIVKTSDPRVGFIPATDPANIKLSDISEALAAAGLGQSAAGHPEKLDRIIRSQRSLLGKYTVKQILSADRPKPRSTAQNPPARKAPANRTMPHTDAESSSAQSASPESS